MNKKYEEGLTKRMGQGYVKITFYGSLGIGAIICLILMVTQHREYKKLTTPLLEEIQINNTRFDFIKPNVDITLDHDTYSGLMDYTLQYMSRDLQYEDIVTLLEDSRYAYIVDTIDVFTESNMKKKLDIMRLTQIIENNFEKIDNIASMDTKIHIAKNMHPLIDSLRHMTSDLNHTIWNSKYNEIHKKYDTLVDALNPLRYSKRIYRNAG